MKTEIFVFGILRSENGILLHKQNSEWTLPGGRVEKNDDIQISMKKHLKQQFNEDLFIIRYINCHDFPMNGKKIICHLVETGTNIPHSELQLKTSNQFYLQNTTKTRLTEASNEVINRFQLIAD